MVARGLMSKSGCMTEEQIALMTAPVSIEPIDRVSVEELADALGFITEYLTARQRAQLDPVSLARKIVIVVRNTRLGYACPACRMGECAA